MILNSNHVPPSFINIRSGIKYNNNIFKSNKIQLLEIMHTMQILNVFIIKIQSHLSF